MEEQVFAPVAAPSEHLSAAFAGEIDAVIAQMLQQSRDNYEQIEAMALECSAALTSASAKANGLSEQSLFRRLWNAVTGKNERLRTAIEADRAAAQYAMQQAINSVLKECTQNRLLALAVKSKLENELLVQRSPEAEAVEDEEPDVLFTPEEPSTADVDATEADLWVGNPSL